MKTLIRNLSTTFKTFLVLSTLSAGVTTYGDDTEVFYSVNVSKPNLLFVLDVSGSMSAMVPGAATGASDSTVSDINSGNDDSFQYRWSSSSTTTGSSIDMSTYTYARFRFIDVDVPQGAEITSAIIQFQSTANESGDAEFLIYMDAVDDAPQSQSIFSASLYGTPTWTTNNNWTTGQRGENQRTPDLKNLVQNVINRSGWQADNAMAFYFGATNNNRKVAGHEHSTYQEAELTIEYTEDGQSRMQVMKSSLRAVLEQSPDNVKVGLMNYGQEDLGTEVNNDYAENYRHHSVSGITFPITDINAKARDIIPTSADVHGLPNYPAENTTIREYIADVADSWSPTSFTPIVDALYEAALYYRGEKAHYGNQVPTKGGAHPVTYDGSVVNTDITDTSGSGRSNSSAPKYKTPIESSCQENYIVLMTDGAPTYRYLNNDGNWESGQGPFASIRGTTNGPQGTLASAISSCATAAGVGEQGDCGAEITNYLATHDNLPNPTSAFPNGQEGDQTIGTYTVGFGIGTGSDTETYLKSLATIDDGNSSTLDDGYFPATSPEQLAAAFRDILAEVSAPKGTLASPGYSVNVKNGLEHEKDIYIPVFDRKNTSRWSGNLKKFRLVDVGGKRKIQGKNNLDATDELGGFTSDALDYWSDSTNDNPDGRVVQRGGIANKLDDPDARNIFSNLSGNSNVNLSATANHLSVSNIANISSADLGLTVTGDSAQDLAYRKTMVNFMRGWENGDATSSDKEPRLHMGDMLHSGPLVVTYNKGDSTGAGKKQYIFAATNEGYLHAFDTATGEEKFAFIPQELLSTISEPQYLNAGTQADHKYGLDGAITGDFRGGADGVVNTGDQVIIYFGMRRGGSSYYALDVTDMGTSTTPPKPKLLWKKSNSNHPSMGMSWSTPYIASIGDSSGAKKSVMIVSGGYDDDEDRDKPGTSELNDPTTSVTANVGNDILIFDSINGNLVWSMPAEMRAKITSSIPGGVKPIDIDGNGLIDRMYFADTGGNVWRLDLPEKLGDTSTGAAVPELTKLASIAGSGADSRKFFNEPEVAKMKLNGKTVFAVSIGSGFRAHPMDRTISDKFYVLIDQSPYEPLVTTGENPFTPIVSDELATITVSNSGLGQTDSIKDVDKRGWVVNFPESGEKVLGTALTVDGKVVFTTLVPEVLSSGVGIDQCAAPITFSRFYAIDILSGGSAYDLNEDGVITDEDIKSPPIGGEPVDKVHQVFNPPGIEITLDDEGNPTGEKTCTHPVDLRAGKKLSQVSGYDACRLESVYWADPSVEQ